MAQATFYTVSGPRGEYYAVENQDTGKIWTERTELAARQQATEEGLEFVDNQAVTHTQLLDLMIEHARKMQVAGCGEPPGPARPEMKVEKGLSGFFRRLRKSNDAAGTGTASR